jgi:ABC-2 type transport system permease protein
MAVFAGYFGALTNTAAKAFTATATGSQFINRLAGVAHDAGEKAFLGIGFLLFMLVLMSYAASAAGSMRQEEAQGYLDNLVVRATSRSRWLWGRIGLACAVIGVGSLVIGLGAWVGLGNHTSTLTAHDLYLAGLNCIPPAVFTLGLGIFALGFVPRLTTVLGYGVIAWSFLIQLVSSGLNLNHWLLDTSVFTHTALTPAASPRWGTGAVFLILGAILALIGAVRFSQRDLAGE